MHPNQIAVAAVSIHATDLFEAVALAREWGFRGFAFTLFAGGRYSLGDLAGFWFDEMSWAEKRRLREGLAAFDTLTGHAPFVDTPLFTWNGGIRREAMRQVKLAIEMMAYLGGSVVDVHANPKSQHSVEESWPEMLDTFRELGDYAHSAGVRIGIETGWPSATDQFARLVLETDHPAVGATIDVGHLRNSFSPGQHTPENEKAYNDRLLELMVALGPKICHCHFHDVRRCDWRDHREVGSGFIDFAAVVGFLSQAGYEGAMTFELEEQDDRRACAASRERVEALLGGGG